MIDIDAGSPTLPPRDDGTPPDTAPRAWLLVFEYDEGGVRLVERQRIEMLAPPDDSELTQQGRAGHWIELRNSNGEALYRQVIAQPFRVSAEVFSPREGATPRRAPVEVVEGRFQVVVPDLPAATDVVFFGLGTPGEQKARAFRAPLGTGASFGAEGPSEASPLLSEKLVPR